MRFHDGTTSLQDALAHWRYHPWDFQRDSWPDAPPDPWQAAQWRKLRGDRPHESRLAMMSCAGAGKSCQLAQMSEWALVCMGEPGFPVRITAASMSATNLESGLWRELRHWIGRSTFLGKILEPTGERIRHRFVPDAYIEKRTWPARANPEQIGDVLSGLHGRYQGYLIDEAGSIPAVVLNRCEQGMGEPGQWGFVWLAGNPADEDSMLGAATRRADYDVVHITADPDDPMRTPRKSVEYARQAIAEAMLGRDDPWVRVYILGMFPIGGVNRLVSREAVEEAMRRNVEPSTQATFARILGLDVGAGGLDPSVIYPRQNKLVLPPTVWRGLDPADGAIRVAKMWDEWDADAVAIDATGGWGASWSDQLRLRNRQTLDVVYSARADEPERYNNVRSEIIWRVREGILYGGWRLPALHERGSKELFEELTEIKYTEVKGKMCMEPKAALKARIGRSSDYLDALANTTRFKVEPKARHAAAHGWAQGMTLRASDGVPSDWSQ